MRRARWFSSLFLVSVVTFGVSAAPTRATAWPWRVSPVPTAESGPREIAAGPAGASYPSAVAASPDGSAIFVTGQGIASGGSYHYFTIAYQATTGAVLWANRYDGPIGHSAATSLTVSPDAGMVLVTGISPGTNVDYATVAYDA
jgi:hypothetical protein